MTFDQIMTWAAAGESETQEFKRSTGQRREAARTLCALLNHRGGRVLFGVEPDGRVTGQQVSDHTLEEIAQELREIEPPAFPAIERVVVGDGHEVRVMSVGTGHSQPYTHRDYATGGSSIGVAMYDDRLEVSSSGTLHFGFTPQALFEPHESRPWNPLIASVFYRRGIIATWGQGTLRMAVWAEEAGLPRPEILEIPGAVVVRFQRKPTEQSPGEAPQKTPEAILELLREQPGLAFSELALLLGKSESAVKRAVRKLRESGRLQRIGSDRVGHWQVNA
ncbi:MAG TPA: hypothetical protein DCY89_00835 [Gammaproteobacteria bacterium]|nr:hypothetical protein [Gammaproteobacteria bacterium]